MLLIIPWNVPWSFVSMVVSLLICAFKYLKSTVIRGANKPCCYVDGKIYSNAHQGGTSLVLKSAFGDDIIITY